MWTKLCVVHNGINSEDQGWIYPQKDVTEIVRIEQKPVTIDKCPKCYQAIERTKELLRYHRSTMED